MTGSMRTTERARRTGLARKVAAMIGSLAVLSALMIGMPSSAQAAEPPGAECWQHGCIWEWAHYERQHATRSIERGGNNCNYYSGYWLTSGDGGCGYSSSGVSWRSNEWCADFARYTWHKAGANVAGLDPWAGSFYRANKSNGSYHSKNSGYTPRMGDAVLFDWDGGTASLGNNGWDIDHVGIVDGYATGWVNSVDGNTSGPGRDGVFFKGRNTSRVVGYVTPRF
jgi:hypothetical protein